MKKMRQIILMGKTPEKRKKWTKKEKKTF